MFPVGPMRSKCTKKQEVLLRLWGGGGYFQKWQVSAIANKSVALWLWHFHGPRHSSNMKESKKRQKAFAACELIRHHGDHHWDFTKSVALPVWLAGGSSNPPTSSSPTLPSASACRQKVNQEKKREEISGELLYPSGSPCPRQRVCVHVCASFNKEKGAVL